MTSRKTKLLGLTKLRYSTYPLLTENMKEMMNVTDPILQILRCHLVTEALLDILIKFAFTPNGVALLSARLSYSQKVQVVSKSFLFKDFPLLPDFVIGSLRKLNSLRNRMAHQLGATVSLEEVNELFQGEEHLLPFTPTEGDLALLIYHYTSFIYGNMLPKFESNEDPM